MLSYSCHSNLVFLFKRFSDRLQYTLCLHLLSNALRASREGGSICIALRRTESDWQMTVTDDGCGLPGEDVQAAQENRRTFLGGAQLGLLLCRGCCCWVDWSLHHEPAP